MPDTTLREGGLPREELENMQQEALMLYAFTGDESQRDRASAIERALERLAVKEDAQEAGEPQ